MTGHCPAAVAAHGPALPHSAGEVHLSLECKRELYCVAQLCNCGHTSENSNCHIIQNNTKPD